ncbi:hypothetical protein RUND412_004709 [Rhizina undulata]
MLYPEITNLPTEILIGMLSACHDWKDLNNLCDSHTVFMETYLLAPTAISKAIFLKELEEMGIPSSANRVFNIAWKILLLTRRIAQKSHAEDKPINALPRETFDDINEIMGIVRDEENKMAETHFKSFYHLMFNSHPNGLVNVTKDEVKGVFIYYSLIIRLYTQETAYYEAVLRENPESPVVEGTETPSKYFFDEYTYKDLFLIFRCSLQSSVKLDFASGILLRDELEQKRVAGRIELKDEDREILFFPDWLDQGANWNGQAAQ